MADKDPKNEAQSTRQQYKMLRFEAWNLFRNWNFGFRTSDLFRIVKRLIYYFKIWLLMSKNSFGIYFNQRSILLIFLIGKLLRFTFFVVFIHYIISGSGNLAGYDLNQGLFFFLTFVTIDATTQFLFREVYRFKPLIVSGDFDLFMVRPVSALFRVLLGGADVIDLVTLPVFYYFLFTYGSSIVTNGEQVLLFIILFINALLMGAAFHIIVLATGIITLEIDHSVMIYRDLTSMGRFPIDIYKEPVRSVLTFVVPVGLMMTFPAKAVMGLVSPIGVLGSFIFGLVLLWTSLKYWSIALRKYTSASS